MAGGRGKEDPDQRQNHQFLVKRDLAESKARMEDGKNDAQQHVHRDLCRGRRQERGDDRRCAGVGVGQPHVQREQRHLQTDTDRQKGEGHQNRAIANFDRVLRQALRQIEHIQTAGDLVGQADPNQQERRADRSHHQVLKGGHQGPSRRAQTDQGVRGQRGDFEKDKQVEQVPGDHDAHQPGQAQQIQAAEQVLPTAGNLLFQAGKRVRNHQGADARDEPEHKAAEDIHSVLDAPGGRPAADFVPNHAGFQDAQQQTRRHGKHRPTDGDRKSQRGPASTNQHAKRRGQQRDNDLQNRQMGVDHGSLSRARISSSSIVPYSSRIRTMSAKASAVVATPTTIAVSINTLGSGCEYGPPRSTKIGAVPPRTLPIVR